MNNASSILIGWDTQDITPDNTIELMGQYTQRVSRGIRDRVVATAMAIEQKTGTGAEQAVLVSLDMSFVTKDFQDEIQEIMRKRLPELDAKKILLNVTHTHTSVHYCMAFKWWSMVADVMQPDECRAFLHERIATAIENAWKNRKPSGVSTARTYATIGFCRRIVYADGTAEMYGDPNRPDFVGVEAGNDPAVQTMFIWDDHKKLTGVVVNIGCPAQVMEAGYEISADFFGDFRKRIHKLYGSHVHVLPQIGASGEQSPRDLPSQDKDPINYWKEEGMVEIARRLEIAVAEAHEQAWHHIDHAPAFKHTVEDVALPVRRATEAEIKLAQEDLKKHSAGYPDPAAASKELFKAFCADVLNSEKTKPHGPYDNKEMPFVKLENALAVLRRVESQDKETTFTMTMHTLRIGDVVFASNPFELYLDFGQAIQARSAAKQTFLIEMGGDYGGYLPTKRSELAGGYGSFIISGSVGDEGGKALVEATLKSIDAVMK